MNYNFNIVNIQFSTKRTFKSYRRKSPMASARNKIKCNLKCLYLTCVDPTQPETCLPSTVAQWLGNCRAIILNWDDSQSQPSLPKRLIGNRWKWLNMVHCDKQMFKKYFILIKVSYFSLFSLFQHIMELSDIMKICCQQTTYWNCLQRMLWSGIIVFIVYKIKTNLILFLSARRKHTEARSCSSFITVQNKIYFCNSTVWGPKFNLSPFCTTVDVAGSIIKHMLQENR